jgi:hypothetical protein
MHARRLPALCRSKRFRLPDALPFRFANSHVIPNADAVMCRAGPCSAE